MEIITEKKFHIHLSYFWKNKKYRYEAKSLSQKLLKLYPNVDISGIDEKGEKNSFEISISTSEGIKDKKIWSGLNKGPPRKLKFPSIHSLVQEIKKFVPNDA